MPRGGAKKNIKLKTKNPKRRQRCAWWHLIISPQGKFEDAELLLVDAVAMGDETLDPEHPRVATFLNCLGAALILQVKPLAMGEQFFLQQTKKACLEPRRIKSKFCVT